MCPDRTDPRSHLTQGPDRTPGHATPEPLGAETPELPTDPLPPAVPPSPPGPNQEPWGLPDPDPEVWPLPEPEHTPWPEPAPTTPSANMPKTAASYRSAPLVVTRDSRARTCAQRRSAGVGI